MRQEVALHERQFFIERNAEGDGRRPQQEVDELGALEIGGVVDAR
jgi:hypothetical protein